MQTRGCVSQFIDNSKEVACSARDSDKYLLINSSPERVSPSITLITPIGPLRIQNKLLRTNQYRTCCLIKKMVVLTVRKVIRIKNCHCCNNVSDLDHFSCSIPYAAKHADSYVVYYYFINPILWPCLTD